MIKKWTEEEIWEWYNNRPWIMGCNFIPSNCINNIEIWQEYNFDKVLNVIDKELGIAEETGFNSVRMVMPFFVWKYQTKGCKRRLDQFLSLAYKHGINLMPVLFDDCCVPKEFYQPKFGEQPTPVPGHHGGIVITPFDGSSKVGYNLCDDIENWPDLEMYVKDLISTFAKDERIIIWDIWNEPGNSNRGTRSLAFMEKVFEIAREQDPIQPLTAGAWNFSDKFFESPDNLSVIEKRAIELSDIVTFHYYGDYEHTVKLIEVLKEYKRPLIITEWLHRPFGNLVETHLPFFKNKKIGCYNWGLVNGKTQTHEPWDSIRNIPGLDFSKWQHDLYHNDGTPYDGKEIKIFQSLSPRGK